MRKEDLKETKIYLSNVEDRIKFQKKMFSLGIKWIVINNAVDYTDCPFYYIDKDFDLQYSISIDPEFFIYNNYKQIFLHDVLAIEEPKEVCEFNPFDKVLVRDTKKDLWLAKFFNFYDYEDIDFPYKTIDECRFGECIKYEGNEHLLMTSDSE